MAAWTHRGTDLADLICHSDAGTRAVHLDHLHHPVAEIGANPSIGTVGDSYDCAMAEALNGSFKPELVHLHGPWRTRHQVELAIIEWIDRYNASRLPPASAKSGRSSTRPTGRSGHGRPLLLLAGAVEVIALAGAVPYRRAAISES